MKGIVIIETNLIEQVLFLFQPPGSDGPDLLQVRSRLMHTTALRVTLRQHNFS